MPWINLINEQRVASIRGERRAQSASAFMVLSIVLGTTGYGFFALRHFYLQAQISTLRSQAQKLQPVLASISKLKQQQSQMQPRMKTLTEAQQMCAKWTGILQYLTVQTPQNLWLTGMRSNMPDVGKPVTVLLDGLAGSQDPVGDFILRVQSEKDLDNVVLHFTQEKREPKRNLVNFEIAADVNGTAVKSVKKQENGS